MTMPRTDSFVSLVIQNRFLSMARKGTAKLNELLSIEKLMQAKWDAEKLFEEDAPDDGR